MKRALPLMTASILALQSTACEPDPGHAPWDAITWDTGYDPASDSTGTDTLEDWSGVDTWGMDRDDDGFTPADGDCNDGEYSVNPNAYDDPENGVDDDCDTVRDNPIVDCDCGSMPTLLEGMDICDMRFVRSVTETGAIPAAAEGRGTRDHYGNPGNMLGRKAGCRYSLLDTGRIEPTIGGVGDPDRQIGTDFYNPSGDIFGMWCLGTEPDPDPLGADPAPYVCDTQQLVIEFTAPANAVGFMFDFVYLSAEYPEWVDEGYNDTFYAIIDRPDTGERINISFDDYGAEIEVDNAFFEDPPVTDLSGTGYSDMCNNEDLTYTICGSSTGWLRTSWEIEPNEQFSLTFSIHDEGDGIYDSLVIIDNFQWSLDEVDPGTILI
jgi:hypothetical protein